MFSTAIVAGVMAVKKTSELIPFCHPLPIEKCDIKVRGGAQGGLPACLRPPRPPWAASSQCGWLQLLPLFCRRLRLPTALIALPWRAWLDCVRCEADPGLGQQGRGVHRHL